MKIVVIGGSGLIGKKVYFGIALNDQSLTPGDNPRIGSTHFDDWLSRPVPQS